MKDQGWFKKSIEKFQKDSFSFKSHLKNHVILHRKSTLVQSGFKMYEFWFGGWRKAQVQTRFTFELEP